MSADAADGYTGLKFLIIFNLIQNLILMFCFLIYETSDFDVV
jgi:hypothetical protein